MIPSAAPRRVCIGPIADHGEPAVYGESHIHFEADDGGGPSITCLCCRQTARAGYRITPTYLIVELYCRECLEPIVRIDQLYGGIHVQVPAR